jgi:coatomer subunit beta
VLPPGVPAAGDREGGITIESFKTLWPELEWENKVNLAVPPGGNFEAALVRVMRATNMTIVGVKDACKKVEGRRITDEEAKREIAKLGELLKIDFISVNLYAKTIFGEDALANVSLQVDENNNLSGSVRFRARTQGIALSLGDKISKLVK